MYQPINPFHPPEDITDRDKWDIKISHGANEFRISADLVGKYLLLASIGMAHVSGRRK